MAREQERAKALNIEIAADGTPPEWVELLPIGDITGRDGRHWVNSNPDALIEAFNAAKVDKVIDWEHATDKRAPDGLDAPAAGWLKEMQKRGASIWGRVAWKS